MTDGTIVARQAGRQAGRVLFLGSGRIVYLDRAAEDLFGWTCAEVAGEPISALLPGLGWEEARSPREGSRPAEISTEVEGRRNGGARFPADCAVTACPVEGDVALLAVVRDRLAERRHAAETAHMDRLLALGTLAAGIGHEMADPVAYLIANLEFMCSAMDEIDATAKASRAAGSEQGSAAAPAGDLVRRLRGLREALDEARHGAARIRDIARNLRTFSRVDERRGPMQVARALDTAIDLAWNEISPRAHIVRRYAPVPLVSASEQRLVQAFLNLLVNAAQSVTAGSPADNEIRVTVACEGGRVAIEVADTGAGIPADLLQRVFDPFFTTKPPGRAMGLGLSVAKDVVNELSGSIDARSEPGKGSVFRIELPVSTDAADG